MEKLNNQKAYNPGSEWLYYKIYCGPKTSDKLLIKVINPLVRIFQQGHFIDKWFFIRYSDPEYHLRVRFHLADTGHYNECMNEVTRMTEPYVRNMLIHKLEIDTYKPEVERYGIQTMEYSESIFSYDSEMCIGLLGVLSGDQYEQFRWLASLKAVDALLNDFNYSDAKKLDLLYNLNMSFSREFNKDKDLANQISFKYRNHRKNIDDWIFGSKDDVMNNYVRKIIKTRSSSNEKISSRIALYCDKDELIDLDNLAGSYIHMMMNRIFRTRHRTMEMVLYDFLFRTYKSMLAKNKYQN